MSHRERYVIILLATHDLETWTVALFPLTVAGYLLDFVPNSQQRAQDAYIEYAKGALESKHYPDQLSAIAYMFELKGHHKDAELICINTDGDSEWKVMRHYDPKRPA